MTNSGTMANFSAADNSASFKFKQTITGKIACCGACWSNGTIKIFK